MLNRSILILCAFFAISVFSVRISAQQLSEEDRNRYVTQVRAYKHDYFVKELDLNKEQQNAFFELYDRMEDRIMDIGTEVRTREQRSCRRSQARRARGCGVGSLQSETA